MKNIHEKVSARLNKAYLDVKFGGREFINRKVKGAETIEWVLIIAILAAIIVGAF